MNNYSFENHEPVIDLTFTEQNHAKQAPQGYNDGSTSSHPTQIRNLCLICTTQKCILLASYYGQNLDDVDLLPMTHKNDFGRVSSVVNDCKYSS